jgi:hypothetical protein
VLISFIEDLLPIICAQTRTDCIPSVPAYNGLS